LERSGVKVRKKEEEFVYKLYKEIKTNSGFKDLKAAFDYFD